MQIRAAFVYMVLSRAVSLALTAISFAVLGRLLAPAAFGHFAVAFAVFLIAETVVQFGLRQYVISRSEIVGPRRIAAAAGLSLAIAVGLCSAGLVAAFTLGGTVLPQPVADCLVPMSLALLTKPLMFGTEVSLHRDVRFALISAIEIIRATADLAVAVTLVLMGFEAASLGWALFASHVVVTGLLVGLGGRDRRILPRLGGWGEFIAWGRRLTAIDMIPKAAEAIMITGLSYLQGMTVVGLFNRANTIRTILDKTLFEAVTPVILPALSASLKAGAKPSDLYRLKIDYLTAICWPGFAFIGVMAEPIVMILLGQTWRDAIPTVRILALTGLGLPATQMSQALFVATDRSELYFKLVLLQDAARVPLAAIGALFSLEAFACAFVAGNWTKATAITVALHRLGVGHGHSATAARGIALTAAAIVGPAIVLLQGWGAGQTLFIAAMAAFAGWLAATALVGHPIFDEIVRAAGTIRRRIARSG